MALLNYKRQLNNVCKYKYIYKLINTYFTKYFDFKIIILTSIGLINRCTIMRKIFLILL